MTLSDADTLYYHLLHAVAGARGCGAVLGVSGEVGLHADQLRPRRALGPAPVLGGGPVARPRPVLLAGGVGRGQGLLLAARRARGVGPQPSLASPPPGLVLVVRVLPLVQLPQPLCLHHEGFLLLLFQYPEIKALTLCI